MIGDRKESIFSANQKGHDALSAQRFIEAEYYFRSALEMVDSYVESREPGLVINILRGLMEALSAQGQQDELLRLIASSDRLLRALLTGIQRMPEPAEAKRPTERLNMHRLLDVCSRLRELGKSVRSVEHFAQQCANVLYDGLTTLPGEKRATSLVRLFQTLPFHKLPAELQEEANDKSSMRLNEDTRCLVLLGTAGKLEAWNDRSKSAAHKVIPLISPEMVANSPMIARLFTELGVNISSLFQAKHQARIFLKPGRKDYNIFYVPDAAESQDIVNREFVREHNIRTVIGYGSIMPSGELSAVILFFHILVSRELAERFNPPGAKHQYLVVINPDSADIRPVAGNTAVLKALWFAGVGADICGKPESRYGITVQEHIR